MRIKTIKEVKCRNNIDNAQFNYFEECLKKFVYDKINVWALTRNNLENYKTLNSLFGSCYTLSLITRKEPRSKFLFLPNIFIITDDIDISLMNLDSRINYLDSSIWNNFVFLKDKEQFTVDLRYVFNRIEKNRELYCLNVCKEFYEFNTRLFINSFLAKIGTGAHATDVTPFKFHSETEMKSKADKLQENLIGYKWRLLILDDYADEKLRCGNEEKGKGTGPTKKDIIERVIENGLVQGKKLNHFIKIETVSSIDEFKRKFMIKKEEQKTDKIYDIILLDYLLDHGDGIKKAEFSTEIFHWIGPEKEEGLGKDVNKNLVGPFGKFWFFPISVFAYAFHEELQQSGHKQLEDVWYIAKGADPVNTPELFRYSLFKLMEMQLCEAFEFMPDRLRYIKDAKISIELFFTTYFSENEISSNIRSVKKIAKDNYENFIKFRNTYVELVKNSDKSSLCSSLLEDKPVTDGHFWGHLHHLMFMLGHEPTNEWPKMWDEFNIIESYLRKLKRPEDIGKSEYLNPIKEYIISLQKEMRGI